MDFSYIDPRPNSGEFGYSITQGLRDSLKEQGTHVVSVHPGPIQTDMGQEAGFGDSASSPSLVAIAISDAIAEGRFHA